MHIEKLKEKLRELQQQGLTPEQESAVSILLAMLNEEELALNPHLLRQLQPLISTSEDSEDADQAFLAWRDLLLKDPAAAKEIASTKWDRPVNLAFLAEIPPQPTLSQDAQEKISASWRLTPAIIQNSIHRYSKNLEDHRLSNQGLTDQQIELMRDIQRVGRLNLDIQIMLLLPLENLEVCHLTLLCRDVHQLNWSDPPKVEVTWGNFKTKGHIGESGSFRYDGIPFIEMGCFDEDFNPQAPMDIQLTF